MDERFVVIVCGSIMHHTSAVIAVMQGGVACTILKSTGDKRRRYAHCTFLCQSAIIDK